MISRNLVVGLLSAFTCLPLALLVAAPNTSRHLRIRHQDRIPDFPSKIDLTGINHPEIDADWMQMKQHGWELFLNLTSTASGAPRKALSKPLWEAWYAKCDLDLNPNCDPSSSGHDTFVGTTPQVDPDPAKPVRQFATVYYSPAAGNWILKNKLNEGSALQTILRTQLDDPKQPGPHSVPAFPRESIVVKEIWEGFTAVKGLGQLEKVRVYDPVDHTYNNGSQTSLAPVATWPTIMTIANQNGVPDTTPCNPGDYDLSTPVPLSCFYHIEFPDKCAAVMEKNDALVPQLPQGTATCYLVLVGVHIATHEIPNWTWSTFWWTNKPAQARQTDPPDIQKQIPPEYSHYVMDTTFGAPVTASKKFIFNPYLEGSRLDGMTTNCFGCHQYAGYQARGVYDGKTIAQHTSGLGINGSGVTVDENNREQLTTPFPCALVQMTGSCPLRTNFLWGIATNQDGLGPSPL